MMCACKAPPAAVTTKVEDEITPGAARQRWATANEQATSIAGNLSIGLENQEAGRISLAFAHGVTLWVRPALLPEEDESVRALVLQTQKRLGAPPDVFPQFYEVVEERVALTAPQGGLCAGLRTRVIAIAEFPDAQDDWLLRIASFHTPVAAAQPAPGQSPPRRVDHRQLRDCFAFDFVRPAPP